jgi:hypothetical protein
MNILKAIPQKSGLESSLQMQLKDEQKEVESDSKKGLSDNEEMKRENISQVPNSQPEYNASAAINESSSSVVRNLDDVTVARMFESRKK